MIREQFPAVETAGLTRLGHGWDNTAFCTTDPIVFRFPRKAAAAALLVTEARVLPVLSTMLPLAIPRPDWRGEPTDRFPWPFLGYRMIPGRTASAARLSAADRLRVAPALARFLARLHAIDPTLLDVPGDVLNRRDFVTRLPLMIERLDVIRTHGIIDDAAPWQLLFRDLEEAGHTEATTLVHGDLYARHLLVDDRARLCGVIDWGDVHAGDPAMDLMLTYGFLPASARGAFFAEYGPVDSHLLRTARLRAAFHAVSVTWYGVELGDAELIDEGRLALQFVLQD